MAPTTKGQGQIELHDLVREMRSEIRRFDGSYVSKMQGEEGSSVVRNHSEREAKSTRNTKTSTGSLVYTTFHFTKLILGEENLFG